MRSLRNTDLDRDATYLLGVLILCMAFLPAVGCTASSEGAASGDDQAALETPESMVVRGIKTAEKIEFPNGDASVPPEQGGPGFTGEGWQTASPGRLGDPDARQGGMLTSFTYSWPENVRVYGTGANTYLNSIIQSLCYETLLSLHPNTLEPIPALATHWQIEEDETLFRFRLNPKAYWSDGKPVTSDDVIATYRLIADDTLVDPMMKQAIVEKMEEPKKISKYIFEVRCKERNWRNFLTLVSNMFILPAHQIGDLAGSDYLNRYSGKLTATSGPYVLQPDDVVQNQSMAFSRRSDYWGDQMEYNGGLYNFTKIRFVIVLDQRLAFDKALRGDVDFHAVYTAQWWAQDIPKSASVKNNYIIAQQVYTKNPAGTQGMAFNMREPPLDDVRVRKALAHLFDRETMLEKFAFNAYEPLKSYFQASDGENPNNIEVKFDPAEAMRLLREAGYTERDPDGVLKKDGRRLSLTITYSTAGFEKYFTVFQEACRRRVGLEIKLDLVDRESEWKRKMSRNFQIINSSWTGSLFPDPKNTWRSNMAETEGSNNIVGFKDERADEIIDAYDNEFDLQERQALLRELDGLVFNAHPYALQWYAPSDRILYLNKFGMPEGGFTRYSDWRAVYTSWWLDPQKEAALVSAMQNGTPLPDEPAEIRYWIEQDAESENATGGLEPPAEALDEGALSTTDEAADAPLDAAPIVD